MLSEFFHRCPVFNRNKGSSCVFYTSNQVWLCVLPSTLSNAQCTSGVTFSFLPEALHGLPIATHLRTFLAIWLHCAHIKTHCHYIMKKSETVPNPGNTAFKQEVACCIWRLICLNLLLGICILKNNMYLVKCNGFKSSMCASYLTSWN